MALGINSTSVRPDDSAVEDTGWLGISNFRKPSWPCELASLVMGCANVRPDDVSASRWSEPAEMETNLYASSAQ